jgi:SAM-dependent methyltransferase
MAFVHIVRSEVSAGGFSRNDGTVQFYSRINALLRPSMHVLDFGAGRGAFVEDDCDFRRSLHFLKGKVAYLVGADSDLAVLKNSTVDKSVVLDLNSPTLPFPDKSFDIVVSDWVLEHLDDPAKFALEMSRIVKPGGWLCARTPNKFGLTAIGATLIPNSLHIKFLKTLAPQKKDIDTFPTRYRINTRRAIRQYFPGLQWRDFSYYWRGDPKYHANSLTLWKLMGAWIRCAPEFMATDLLIFLQRI